MADVVATSFAGATLLDDVAATSLDDATSFETTGVWRRDIREERTTSANSMCCVLLSCAVLCCIALCGVCV
jgi:hypothetical protein